MNEIINEDYYIRNIYITKDNNTIYLVVVQVNKDTKNERQVITGFSQLNEAKATYEKIKFLKDYQEKYLLK